MKKNISGLTLLVSITCCIIACSGCKKDTDSSTENLSHEGLLQKAQGMLSPEDLNLLDLNWVDTSTYSKEDLDNFFDLHMTLFLSRAYIVFYANEENPTLTDVLLVPLESDFAEIINFDFTERLDMLDGFQTKDKKRLHAWMDKKHEEGCIVVVRYDKKTKMYDATAFTKAEWALIMAR